MIKLNLSFIKVYMMTTTIIGGLIWLLPFLIYLLAFSDPPNMRIIWSFVTILFSWVGLLARVLFGVLKTAV